MFRYKCAEDSHTRSSDDLLASFIKPKNRHKIQAVAILLSHILYRRTERNLKKPVHFSKTITKKTFLAVPSKRR
jgi:hypothetical protein